MKFSIFQINLSDEQYNVPNVREMYLNTIMNPTDSAINKAKSLYNEVAVIDAENFDNVFQIGNIGPEENITRKAPMHSVSVGDIIRREDGVTKFVAPFGFTSIAF